MSIVKTLIAGVIASTFAVASVANAEGVYLKMDSLPAGTSAGQFNIAFSQVVQKYLPYQIQISVGKPATKSALAASKQQIDLFVTAPTINHFMQKKAAMFKKIPDADLLNQNLRGIINYSLGPYHIIVYESSGIKSLSDIKGKKVFLGPPAGAATKVTTQIIAGVTGYVPGEDFEIMRFDWATAETAFIDRQIDVMMQPTTIPSPAVQQYAASSKIRLLGIPDEAMDSEAVKTALSFPGRTIIEIPAGLYNNQVNETAVKTIGSWVGLGTHKWADEEVIYNMTKAYWEHTDEIYATAEWMKGITRKSALLEMNIPLHIGAYKYYKEAGFDIPAHIIPPEAG